VTATRGFLGERALGVVLCASLSTVAWAQQSEDIGRAPSGSVAVTIPSRVWTGPTGNVLYDNGPFADSTGAGVGGADESILENVTLGMVVLGWSHHSGGAVRIADDFTATDPAGWQVDTITFFTYQTGSTTTSPPPMSTYGFGTASLAAVARLQAARAEARARWRMAMLLTSGCSDALKLGK